MRGYQDYSPDGFHTGTDSIDSHYIDGISITHGNPRTHLWSYAAGLTESQNETLRGCPCARPDPTDQSGVPTFVGEHFYCESGFSGSIIDNRGRIPCGMDRDVLLQVTNVATAMDGSIVKYQQPPTT